MAGIRLHIRGKAHAEWKITRAGERRTVRQDEHYIDERQLLWGKGQTRGHLHLVSREGVAQAGLPFCLCSFRTSSKRWKQDHETLTSWKRWLRSDC